ncbi:hypothetical protein QTP70_000620 [Hemibagrus guttatus]|uniref:Uncharacterized protein n=1 Tax=Hemibagrus guttatus TaxID=175788 RepID=A0AAE0PSH9_9TELE|nr:hypothetical protein QTP70_000620 [Hemibagrus guttatus]
MTAHQLKLNPSKTELLIIPGLVKVAVRSALLVSGVSLNLGNDIAGNKMYSLPEVVSDPVNNTPDVAAQSWDKVEPRNLNNSTVATVLSIMMRGVMLEGSS